MIRLGSLAGYPFEGAHSVHALDQLTAALAQSARRRPASRDASRR